MSGSSLVFNGLFVGGCCCCGRDSGCGCRGRDCGCRDCDCCDCDCCDCRDCDCRDCDCDRDGVCDGVGITGLFTFLCLISENNLLELYQAIGSNIYGFNKPHDNILDNSICRAILCLKLYSYSLWYPNA